MIGAIGEENLKLAEKLSEPKWGGYPQPRYDGFSIANLGPTVFKEVGGKGTGLLPTLSKNYAREGGTSTAVVLLIDSFGWKLFCDALERAHGKTERAVMDALARCTTPMTTVFPSTTSSALISLSTGTAPATHGIVGYTEYMPSWGAILNTLKFNPSWGGPRDLAVGKGFKPQEIASVPTLFQRGLRSTALSKTDFEGTAFTRLLYDGAAFEGYVSLSDLSMHLKRILSREPSKRPQLLWVYWDLLDAVHHLNGPVEDLAVSEIVHLFLTLHQTADRMSPKEREGISISVSGDHGQIEAKQALAKAAHSDATLMSLLRRPPSGERRAAFLEARSGKKEELGSYLKSLEKLGWVSFTVDEVLSGGLLGPPPHHPEIKDRLGDYLLLPPPGAALYYRPPGSRGKEDRFLKGAHGGLTREEMLIPLVSTSAEEISKWDL